MPVFRRHLDGDLSNAVQLLVSPKAVRKSALTVDVGPFQLKWFSASECLGQGAGAHREGSRRGSPICRGAPGLRRAGGGRKQDVVEQAAGR